MPKLARLLAAAALSFPLAARALPSEPKGAEAKPADAKAAAEKSPEQKAAELKLMKEHFSKGLTHYSLGEFPEAAAEFKEAYRLHREPAILFNIAQAMRQMNDHRHAYFYYAQYLSQRPDASNRTEVEQLMSSMQRKMDEDEAQKITQQQPVAPSAGAVDGPAAKAAEAGDPAAAPEATSAAPAEAVSAAPAPAARETFWSAPHIGGVAAGGGAVLLGAVALLSHSSAQSSADTLNQRYAAGTLTAQDSTLKSDVQSKGTLATIGAIGGAVLLVTGAVLVFAF